MRATNHLFQKGNHMINKTLKEEIVEIMKGATPPEAKYYGGVVDWEVSFTKKGAEYLASLILLAIQARLPKEEELIRQLLQAERERVIDKIDKVYKKEGGIYHWLDLREKLSRK